MNALVIAHPYIVSGVIYSLAVAAYSYLALSFLDEVSR